MTTRRRYYVLKDKAGRERFFWQMRGGKLEMPASRDDIRLAISFADGWEYERVNVRLQTRMDGLKRYERADS